MSSSTVSTHDTATASLTPLLSGEQLERHVAELSLHARAELDPNAFWAEQAQTLHWDKPFTTVLDDSNPPFYKWFTDGTLNMSYNCVDRHV